MSTKYTTIKPSRNFADLKGHLNLFSNRGKSKVNETNMNVTSTSLILNALVANPSIKPKIDKNILAKIIQLFLKGYSVDITEPPIVELGVFRFSTNKVSNQYAIKIIFKDEIQGESFKEFIAYDDNSIYLNNNEMYINEDRKNDFNQYLKDFEDINNLSKKINSISTDSKEETHEVEEIFKSLEQYSY